ncbi:hypothetical protein [Streptomyces sp. NPDC002467]|uniref:hypothetical protein n=1 Tax=Streptomyces sp. NPDC002467 TaxID=3364647 RepID=UPI0036AE974F
MNTRSIELAAQIICARMARPNAVPATIAVALDANGLLNSADGAVELLALRARVAELEADLNARGEDLAAAVAGWGRSRDRVAELEAESPAGHRFQDGGGRTWRARGGSVELLQAVRPAEDPYESPLHHDYKTGRDLPEVPSV